MSIRSLGQLVPQVHADAYVDESALVIGDVEIGAHSSVWPMAVIRGDIHSIRIGQGTNIQDGSVLHVTHDSKYNPGGRPLYIGNDVTIGHKVILHGCHIQDRCLVGMGSIIMDDVEIESGVMVAAGSLVTPGKTLNSGFLWMGRPARAVRELTEEEREYLGYSVLHYRKLKDHYLSQGK